MICSPDDPHHDADACDASDLMMAESVPHRTVWQTPPLSSAGRCSRSLGGIPHELGPGLRRSHDRGDRIPPVTPALGGAGEHYHDPLGRSCSRASGSFESATVRESGAHPPGSDPAIPVLIGLFAAVTLTAAR